MNEEKAKKLIHGIFSVFICIMFIVFLSLIYQISYERGQLQSERHYYEGNVTEVTYFGHDIIIEFDNESVVRMGLGIFRSEAVEMQYNEYYVFTVDGYYDVISYEIIEGRWTI